MTQDSFTEVRTQSWFSRIRDSFIGVLLGLLLFAASFFVLWFNEGRSVKTAAALREVEQTVIPLASTEVSAQNEGKLIYVTGTAMTAETLTDSSLGITANAVKLLREVEMYQWVESSKSQSKEKVGGGKETAPPTPMKPNGPARPRIRRSLKNRRVMATRRWPIPIPPSRPNMSLWALFSCRRD